MRSKTTDRNIVILLLAALALETFLLLWHLDVIALRTNARQESTRPAGQIARAENDLRRRERNGLVWEKAAPAETVYYFDSLLTLAQSTARLKLDHGGEVELSENTLVTIEPEVETRPGEIRLRFTRGSVRARNPYKDARIEAPEFSLDVKAGSELSVRQVGDGEFEVRVEKGEARVQGAQGEERVDADRVLRVREGELTATPVSRSLKWKSTPLRIYTHDPVVSVPLKFEGPVQEVSVQRSGAEERVLPPSESLPLEPGQHRLVLRAEDGAVSEPLEVDVWRAPTLHLLAPLPRNRVRTEENVNFVWTRVPDAKEYRIEIRGGVTRTEKAETNSFTARFEDEADAQWGVWARDADGFEIPPLYTYPLYIRHAPLGAPKLKAPVIRKPASDNRGASLWNLFFPRAHAAEVRFEALFRWESVEGADEYIVEISETPDFRTPVVTSRVKKTEFLWQEAKPRTYYWRVAGAAKSGRMGLFSEPEKMDASELTPVTVAVTAPVAVDGKQKTDPEPKLEPMPVQIPVPVPLPNPQNRVWWRPGWQNLEQKGGDFEASLNGLSFAGIGAQGTAGRVRWQVEGSRTTYKPTPTTSYPFQADLTATEVRARVSRAGDGAWNLGLALELLPRVERDGLESVKLVNAVLAGPVFSGQWRGSGLEYELDLTALAGSGFGARVDNRIWCPYGRLQFGLGVGGTYLFEGLSTEARLLLGVEF